MKRALVFGASGQIGRAVAAELLASGWQVDAVTRGRPLPSELAEDARHLIMGDSRAAMIAARPSGYDGVFDPLCYTAADAADLLDARSQVGALVVISTASVYADAEGRGFETDPAAGPPHYPDPIPEAQPRVPPGAGYSAAKVAMEDRLAGSAAILRPAAVHGIGARHPREFWFVKRFLDRRLTVPLMRGGDTVFHTSSTAGIASLTALCLEDRLTGAFNVADPVALPALGIGRLIADIMGVSVRFTDPGPPPIRLPPARPLPPGLSHVGQSPWSVENPLRLDLARARATGWDGGPDYAERLAPYVNWLCQQAANWREAFPAFGAYGHDPFDYGAEDRALGRL